MRTQRMYDPSQTFYALKTFKYAGRDYKRGDLFKDSRDMTNNQLLKFFQNGFVGYEGDFKYNKPDRMKEVEKEVEKEEVKEEPVKAEEEKVEEKPKTTRRRRTKKTSEESSA